MILGPRNIMRYNGNDKTTIVRLYIFHSHLSRFYIAKVESNFFFGFVLISLLLKIFRAQLFLRQILLIFAFLYSSIVGENKIISTLFFN